MWSGKMATRWRRKDGHLNPGKGHFLSSNNPNEFVLNTDVEMDTHSVVDHSILAIFEDSSALSEDKAGAEEDSEKLLSALTEMLESVEDDDDTLSPFNTLPETSLLRPQDTAKKINVSDPHEHQQMSWNDVMKQAGALSQPDNNKVDSDVDVFASASLVNLVRIMHSYCLKLQVEEEPGKSIKNSVLFSKEEVWKYERPSEDIDEEINVVSDDDEAVGAQMKECDNSSKPLKSALLNGSPSKKEKKRVSFGAVQVTSFDLESVQVKRDIASSAANHCPDALANDTALESTISSENDIITDTPQKPEGKRKPISLQQYRQLRQKRQPLVEKGNYTTKWPSVTVPPKELTPILGVSGQKTTSVKPVITQNSIEGTKTSSDVQPLKTKASNDLPHKAKRPRIKPVASLPNLPLPLCKKSPTKKPTILSSDPPNPVLVPLPDQHTTPSEHALHQNRKTHHSQQLLEDKSITKSISAPKCNNQSPIPAEQHKHLPNTLDVIPVNSPLLPYEPPTPVTTPVKEMTPEAFKLSLPSPCLPPSSGIEASDLTSLLEQFEETQAKEEGESVRAPQIHLKPLSELDRASPNSILWTSPVSSPDLALPMPRMETPLSTSAPLDDGPNLKIPEPLGTEVILSSTQDQPVRPKGPPVKAIQIIDPRPLPFKRTHTSQLESSYTPAHVYLAISADHDYCTVTSETIEIKQASPSAPIAGPKPTSKVNTLENSSNMNATQEEGTKLPMVHPTLLTDGAKKQNNSDVRLDTYMIPPTPPPSPPLRGGDRISPPRRGRDSDRRRYFRRSRSSASSSSSSSCSSTSSSSSRSGSRSPKRQRRHRHSSESSSCSSSASCSGSPSPPRRHTERYSRPRFSRSRSSSWSRSRSRSRSLSPRWRVARRQCTDVGSRESRKLRREQEVRVQKLRAIDERRVVYVGRIRRCMTHEELRERFTQFGEVESVSLHFRDRGDHYGFVTFYHTDDAFAAIDNGEKIRKNDELPFDICFGGRRQFCNSHYADLDANRDAEPSPARSRFGDVDFDLLLKQAQRGLKR
uniref:Si:dkey-93h22.8 n=1 Tax=Neogobius melanostomus TaxID=47308 RepID=A0A8C6T795_9GOBI